MAIHCNGRLVCHQEMERQRGERAQGYDEELGLVLDQRLDRSEQRKVKLVCGSKIGAELLRPVRTQFLPGVARGHAAAGSSLMGLGNEGAICGRPAHDHSMNSPSSGQYTATIRL